MEDPEVPIEECQKHIEEQTEGSEGGGARWVMGVALSTAVFAAIAAVASLLAGRHANEAIIAQIQASDSWSYYQAKGIKAGVLSAKLDIMRVLERNGQANLDAQRAAQAAKEGTDEKKLQSYIDEQAEKSKEARAEELESAVNMDRHEKLAFAVTLFQIAIAVSAIAVLTRKRRFWFVGLAFGAGGIVSLAIAYLW